MAKIEYVRHTCDRCGVSVDVPVGQSRPVGWATVLINQVEAGGESMVVESGTGGPADICAVCSQPLRTWWLVKHPEAEPNPPNPPAQGNAQPG